jgi:hypothetical protein
VERVFADEIETIEEVRFDAREGAVLATRGRRLGVPIPTTSQRPSSKVSVRDRWTCSRGTATRVPGRRASASRARARASAQRGGPTCPMRRWRHSSPSGSDRRTRG